MNEMRDILHERHGDAVRASRNAGFLNAPLLSWFTTMLVGGFFLGWIGAMGSYQYALSFRLCLWLGLCAVAGMLALSIETILLRIGIEKRGIIVTGLSLTFSLAAAMTPIVYLLNSIGEAQPIAAIPRYLANSVVISALLVSGRLMLGISRRKKPGTDSARVQTDHPALMRRLKQSLRDSDLYALKSEGHYVRVFTKDGDDLILMRLKDAIAEAKPVEGRQTHRSWWIARDAIKKVTNTSGKTEILTRGDQIVPVSRTNRPILIEAGWFEAKPG